MRRRLLDNVLTSISALCVFQVIRDFTQEYHSDNTYSWINIVITLVELIVFLIILSNFYYKKRMLVDAFDLLKTMSKNNKLHTLREVIMVVNDQYEKSKNKYKISDAEFQYQLLRSGVDNKYDVIYKITLNLKKRFFRKNNNMLKFYAILDIDGYMETDNIPIDVLLQSRDIPYINFTTFPESVTISKIDHIKKFSGLSEIKIHIPEKIIKRFKMNYIRCEISYTVRNNFKLTNNIENCDYNFFIYPNNYGRGMEKCSIKVFVPKDENYGIVCHHFCIGNVADKLLDFYPDEKENNKSMHQIIFSGSFIPQKNTAYFINLKKIVKEQHT